MKIVRRIAIATAGTLAVALVVTLAAPKAAHAILSALVTITNTADNPVPTYDSSVRFQADVCFQSGPVSAASQACGLNNSATFQVPTTTSSGAAVKRLIVDDVSGICSSFNNPTLFIKSVRLTGQFVPDSVPNGEPAAVHYVPIVGAPYSYVNVFNASSALSNIPETDYSFGQNTHFSFNPGDTVTLSYFYFFTGAGAQDAACTARIEGYLEASRSGE